MSDKIIRNVHNRIVVKSTHGLSSFLLNLTIDLQNNYTTNYIKTILLLNLRIFNLPRTLLMTKDGNYF